MDSQVAKRNSAGALANINLRADSGKGAEEIKSDDVSTPILKFYTNYLQSVMREMLNMWREQNQG